MSAVDIGTRRRLDHSFKLCDVFQAAGYTSGQVLDIDMSMWAWAATKAGTPLPDSATVALVHSRMKTREELATQNPLEGLPQ